MAETYYTIKALAEHLQVSDKLIRNEIANGHLKTLRVGKVTESAFNNYKQYKLLEHEMYGG